MPHTDSQPNPYFLAKGSHDTRDEGMCAMEWAAYLAGLEHTDQPACVSPVLRTFAISLNDNWDDDQRQKLRPYLARCLGTAGDGRDVERSWMCVDWLIREFTPAWMDLTPALKPHGDALRALSPVLAVEAVDDAWATIAEAKKAAAAAWDAARDAAWDAAWAAARAAARAAAWDAAWDAAWAAAWAAARDAARDAAWAAAGDAARDALKPTVERLQASALNLFNRMLPTEVIQLPVVADAEAVCGVPVVCGAPNPPHAA